MTERDFLMLDQRLTNWGRWVRDGHGYYGTCASAERYYVPPRDDEQQRLEQIMARVPVDVNDAELVECAIVRVENRRHRKFLCQVYYRRFPRHILCDRFGIKLELYDGLRCSVLEDFRPVLREREESLLIRRGKRLWAGSARWGGA